MSSQPQNSNHLDHLNLQELFKLAKEVGGRRYHRLTDENLEDYHKYDHWRYINGNSECHSGSTPESQQWVHDNSGRNCPICDRLYRLENGRSIDHKLPRSQYPWLALDFRNLWVICHECNQEKGEMHWYEYEHYIFINYPDRYQSVRLYRPTELLKSL